MNVAVRPQLPVRNILSLCAGVGGLELGIHLALDALGEQGRGICYVEREAAAAASLVASMEAGWFHPAPVWSDMLTFNARSWSGLVHILASGDPCQDNSVAGKRAGADGARFLAPEVCRIAAECRPDVIFRENVPGNAGGQLEAIVPPLERLGYRVAAGIFSSAETRNTMRRERLFIMAVANGGRGGDRGLQRGGEIGFQSQSDGTGGSNAGAGQACATQFGHEWGGSTRRRGNGPSDDGIGMGGPVCGGNGRLSPHARQRTVKRALANGTSNSGEPELVRPPSDGRGEGRPEHEFRSGRDAVASTGCAGERDDTGPGLAGACGTGPQGKQRGQHHATRREIESGHAGLRGRAVLPPAVIPGPTDIRWIDVLDRFPELQPALSQEEAESHLRRGVDAMAHRIERLRATGNGVDPVAAAYAYLSLRALHFGSGGGWAGTVDLPVIAA